MSIESEEFYYLCQAHRFAPITDPKTVVEAYKALITHIDDRNRQLGIDRQSKRLTFYTAIQHLNEKIADLWEPIYKPQHPARETLILIRDEMYEMEFTNVLTR